MEQFTEDVNKSVHNLVNQIQNKIKVSIKNKKKTKNNNLKRKGWITNGITISCLHKNYLYEQWKLQKNNIDLKNRFINYNKILQKIIKVAKLC